MKLEAIDKGHGSPFDRGRADFWYHRNRQPHKYPNGTGCNPRVEEAGLTSEEIAAYHAGYDEAERDGEQKDWD